MEMTFIFAFLPLLVSITMSLIIHKEKCAKCLGDFYIKCLQLRLKQHNEIPLNEIPLIINEESSNENELLNIVDDSRRKDATICDM